MAMFRTRYNFRYYLDRSFRHLRRQLYSIGSYWGETRDIELTGNWDGNDPPQVGQPFVRLDLITGQDIRPPNLFHLSTLRGFAIEDGSTTQPAAFVPQFEYLPGVVEDVATRERALRVDDFIQGRIGQGISWLHMTALQSKGDWIDDQPVWNGAPRLEFLVEGIRVAQPALNSSGEIVESGAAFTSNPALIRAHLLHHYRGVPWANIDLEALDESSRICNQTYCTFANPDLLAREVVINSNEPGGWLHSVSLRSTVTLPGATADTKITAVAQDPANPRHYVLLSSGDRKMWEVVDGEATAIDSFPALPSGVSEMHFRGSVGILQNGLLIANVFAGTRTVDSSQPDGFAYSDGEWWQYYRRISPAPPGSAAVTNLITDASFDAVGDHSWSRYSVLAAGASNRVVGPYLFRLAQNTNIANRAAHTGRFLMVTRNVINRSSLGTELILTVPFGAQAAQGSFLGEPDLDGLVSMTDDGIFTWFLYDDNSIRATSSVFGSNATPATITEHPTLTLDTSTSSFEPGVAMAGLLWHPNRTRLLVVHRDVNADGEVTLDVLRRTSGTQAFQYRLVDPVIPSGDVVGVVGLMRHREGVWGEIRHLALFRGATFGPIPAETEDSYNIDTPDLGHYIQARATFDDENGDEQVRYAPLGFRVIASTEEATRRSQSLNSQAVVGAHQVGRTLLYAVDRDEIGAGDREITVEWIRRTTPGNPGDRETAPVVQTTVLSAQQPAPDSIEWQWQRADDRDGTNIVDIPAAPVPPSRTLSNGDPNPNFDEDLAPYPPEDNGIRQLYVVDQPDVGKHLRAKVTLTRSDPPDGQDAVTEHFSLWENLVVAEGEHLAPPPTTVQGVSPTVGLNRLVIISVVRNAADGGPRDIAYVTPRDWFDVDTSADAYLPGQARHFQGSVYWRRDAVPDGYWDDPPEFPGDDWTRLPGTRHYYAPGGLSSAQVARLTLLGRRYDAHGEISTESDWAEVERHLDNAMLGKTTLFNGVYYIRAGRGEWWLNNGVRPKQPITAIGDQDLVGDGLKVVETIRPGEDQVNYLSLQLDQDESAEWTPQTVIVQDAWSEIRDGKRLSGSQNLPFVTSPTQARHIGNALLMERRFPMRIECDVSPRLGERMDEDRYLALTKLKPGDVVAVNFSLLAPEDMHYTFVVERTSVSERKIVTLNLRQQVVGHTDQFTTLPSGDPRRTLVPLRRLTRRAGGIDQFLAAADLEPTDPDRPLVCAAGMSADRRFLFLGMNEANVKDRNGDPLDVRYQVAIPGTPAVPEQPVVSSASYTFRVEDEGNRVQPQLRWQDSNGVHRVLNGPAGLTVAAAGSTNPRNHNFNHMNVTGNYAVNDATLLTIDRDAVPNMDDSMEVTVRWLRRLPGEAVNQAATIIEEVLQGFRAGIPEVPATTETRTRTTVPPLVYVFDQETGNVGAFEHTYWTGTPTGGQAIGGYQGDPRLSTNGGSGDEYPDGADTNSLTLPVENAVVVGNFDVGDVSVTPNFWIRDMEQSEQPPAPYWDFNPGLAFKHEAGSGTLGPATDTRGLMTVCAWLNDTDGDGNPRERFCYASEAFSLDDMDPRGALRTDVREDYASHWNGTVAFEGDAPLKEAYSAIHDDGVYSYWLRTDGHVELRGTIRRWDRQAPIKRHTFHDIPGGLIPAGASIAVRRSSRGNVRIVVFQPNGTGFFQLSNEGSPWRLLDAGM